MAEFNEISFLDLRKKEVVNSADGKRLGRIIDIVISLERHIVQGIIVPFGHFNFFNKQQNIFIPFTCINKIGEDVILVDITYDADGNMICRNNIVEEEIKEEIREDLHANCDKCCEKCMQFDCENRWKV